MGAAVAGQKPGPRGRPPTSSRQARKRTSACFARCCEFGSTNVWRPGTPGSAPSRPRALVRAWRPLSARRRARQKRSALGATTERSQAAVAAQVATREMRGPSIGSKTPSASATRPRDGSTMEHQVRAFQSDVLKTQSAE